MITIKVNKTQTINRKLSMIISRSSLILEFQFFRTLLIRMKNSKIKNLSQKQVISNHKARITNKKILEQKKRNQISIMIKKRKWVINGKAADTEPELHTLKPKEQ